MSLNDPKIKPGVGEPARTSVPEPVYMHPLHNTRLLRVTLEHLPHIAIAHSFPSVSTKQKLTIHRSDGKPFVNGVDGFGVHPNHSTLASLSLEYSDGTVVTVDVTESEGKCFIASKLTSKVDHDEGTVASAGGGWWKRLEDFVEGLIPEHFRWEC